MRKLLVIIRREYLQRVRTKAFLFATLLMPLFVVFTAVAPALLFSIKSGGATRIAVVDETGQLYESVRDSILTSRGEDEEGKAKAQPQMPAGGMPGAQGSEAQMRQLGKAIGQKYEIEQVQTHGRPTEEIKRELNGRVKKNELDGYVILPANVLSPGGRAEYRARNLGDMIATSQIRHSLRRAVIEQRMRDAQIDPRRVRDLSKEIEMDALPAKEGGEKDTGQSFGLAMGVGLFIYMGILLYGQMIMSSVVEEKTTRISEVLFSSVKSFQLMAGKLVGISLVGMTQFAIWALAFLLLSVYGVAALASRGMKFALPGIPPVFFLYAFVFFVLGFFMYATIFMIVGSVVTTEKEAGQLAMPIIFLSVASVYMIFPVIRAPNSPLAFWVSISPFFSPVTMLVRIVTETPPLWQIALSVGIAVATILACTWVAARVYRVGMLMYGKTASIPEVLRWLRRA
ncbi:MAG: ABC transporter permease [Acidobacteria bacterium]|nr:ABC transporter permease [Acidobacteriota bacterium]MCA1641693.1 ABC transporter permease [Acidobacteriota bacterium]